MSKSNSRVIRKYPNRRLYDTDESRYISLNDIRRLVLEECPFVVIDKTSGNDITRHVLLQLIADREREGDPVFNETFLTQVIRCQGHGSPPDLAARLESSLWSYLDELHDVSRDDSTSPLTSGPQMP